MPLLRSLRASSREAIRFSVLLVSVVKDVGVAANVPPLSGVAALVLAILNGVQNAQRNKDQLAPLGRRTYDALRLIKDKINDACQPWVHDQKVWDLVTPQLRSNINDFDRTLNAILIFVKTESQASASRRFFRQDEIRDNIAKYMRLLESAERAFQVATILDIHRLSVLNLHTSQDLVTNFRTFQHQVNDIKRQFIASHPSPGSLGTGDFLPGTSVYDRTGLRIFRASELQVSKESNIESGWWSDSNEVIVNTKSLFVKWYTGNRAQSRFLQDLQDLKRLTSRRHINLPQLFGRSGSDETVPFLVLSDAGYRSARLQVQSAFYAMPVVGACQLVAGVALEIVSAIRFLRHGGLVTRPNDLSDVLNVSNMVIDLNGHIVLAGQLPTPAEATPHLSPRDEDSLSWAFSIDARRALDAIIGIDYSSLAPTPQDDDSRKLRLADRLIYELTSPNSVLPIADQMDLRESIGIGRPLPPFPEFRRQTSPIWSKVHYFSPGSHRTWSLGDIIRRPTASEEDSSDYIFLENVATKLGPVEISPWQLRYWGDHGDVLCSEPTNDYLRYTFRDVRSIDFRVRQDSIFRCGDICWEYLRSNAIQIGRKHSCAPYELILVTGVRELTQSGGFRCTVDGTGTERKAAPHDKQLPSCPSEVHLEGFTDPSIKWGWQSADLPKLSSLTIESWISNTEFNMYYVQLEPEDFSDLQSSVPVVSETKSRWSRHEHITLWLHVLCFLFVAYSLMRSTGVLSHIY